MRGASVYQLLVEGKDDVKVIGALCAKHTLPNVINIETPKDEGIEALLRQLPIKLREENWRTLGIVVDADQDISARWQAVKDRLAANGYADIPSSPPLTGWISSTLPKRVGVWLMPDNRNLGMLEDFARHLIPNNDPLLPKAEKVLSEIESEKFNRYSLVHRPKALIHTWLAWQEKPGMPMGQAITAQVLLHNAEISNSFIAWLKRLFDLPA
ncbi:MAG: hypothetical protein HZB17_14090 [Chloroflexi bacterium]|nr:hypothetical protein [Chloroflexota bacterium]